MNKSQEILLELYEAKNFNMDIRNKVKNMDKGFLARLVGVNVEKIESFKNGFFAHLDKHTQFKSLKDALKSYLSSNTLRTA